MGFKMEILHSRIPTIRNLLLAVMCAAALSACGPPQKPSLEKTQEMAAAGDINAQYDLGTRYQDGSGVAEDLAKAAEWFQKAATQGHLQSQKEIAWMYAKGSGIPADAAKAMEWYQKAANQGDALAQYRLGEIYHEGWGTNKDINKAREWLEKSAIQGRVDAQYKVGLMYLQDEDFYEAREYLEKAAIQGHTDAQYHWARMLTTGKGMKKNPNNPLLAYAWAQLAATQGHKDAEKLRNSVRLSQAQRLEAQQWAINWKRGQTLPAN